MAVDTDSSCGADNACVTSPAEQICHENQVQKALVSSNRQAQPIEIIVRQEKVLPSRQLSESDDDGDTVFVDASMFCSGEDDILSIEHGRSHHFRHEFQMSTDGVDELGSVEKVNFEEGICFPFSFGDAKDTAEHFMKRVWEASWKVTHFYSLPPWLQDNDFLHSGHRPPLPSFSACFKSIFRIHTETGNIWSHLLGAALFVGIAGYFLTRPEVEVQWEEKLVFSAFYVGAVACLGLSFAFHTVHCHSHKVGMIFSKLDYCGITMLITGSFIPWLYYGFYCRQHPQIVYISSIGILGIVCLIVSLWDKFSTPNYRPLRAALFVALGLSGIIPCFHYFITDGFWSAVYDASLGWIMLMALLYLTGVSFYAFRIPERFFPGKFDIWFQSHQIWHLFVVAAAVVHYHGITEMAQNRLSDGSCEELSNRAYFESLFDDADSS